jgi:hypothetical protein
MVEAKKSTAAADNFWRRSEQRRHRRTYPLPARFMSAREAPQEQQGWSVPTANPSSGSVLIIDFALAAGEEVGTAAAPAAFNRCG